MIGGVAVIVIVTGGGQVELKTLELGLEDVNGASVLVEVVTPCDELEAELVVEDTTLEVDVGDGDAEVELVVVVVVVVHDLDPV